MKVDYACFVDASVVHSVCVLTLKQWLPNIFGSLLYWESGGCIGKVVGVFWKSGGCIGKVVGVLEKWWVY